MDKLKVVIYLLMLFSFESCSNASVTSKDEVVANGFDDILESMDSIQEESSETKSAKNKDSFISDSLIEFVMKSKLQKKVKKLNQKSSKEKNEKERRKNEEAGIGRFSDTIPYKSANILSTEKCSLLLEKKVIVRKRLTICLKKLKMLPLLNKVYSFKKLLKLNKQCENEHKLFIKSIRFYKSKKCYNENYKKGKFISPLNLIK